MKKIGLKVVSKAKEMYAVITMWLLVGVMSLTAYAEDETEAAGGITDIDTSAITRPFDVLLAISVSLVASIGGIFFVWGIWEIANSLRQHDTSMLGQALAKTAGGALAASVSIILAYFNFVK